jgi:iron complex outermembrane receptor protein
MIRMKINLSSDRRNYLMRGASLGAIALLTMSPAFAQGTGDGGNNSVESVVVTGTLIKGIQPVGAHVVGFSAADIQSTGAMTTDQVLSNIPQISSTFNTAPQTNTAGGVGHDTQPKPVIRNLNSAGGAATLVMVDGHNLVGDGVLQTTPDPTTIPAMVLQRVDVVPDGGSSIYGSNAVAGIINFITRRSFEGFQAQTSIGTTGNYDSFQVGAIAGHDWGSGGAYLAYDYRSNGAQFAADRPYPRENLIPLGGTQDNRSFACALPNVTAGSNKYALTINNVANTPGALAAAAVLGQNRCDTTELYSSTFGKEDQHSLFGKLTQQITPDITFTLTASYARRDSTGYSPPLSATNQTITNANPYFQSINGETKQQVSFNLQPVFGNNVLVTDKFENYSVTPDLDIKLGGSWDLDLLGNYGRSVIHQWTPSMNNVTLDNALTSSDPAHAINPYNLSLSDQGVLEQIQNFGNYSSAIQQLAQLRAIARGSIFSLPGGDVQLAVGGQYDYEGLDAVNLNGPTGQRSGAPVPGGLVIAKDVHRIVRSVFGEVVVPLIGDANALSFVHSLALDVSARYDSYSDVGSTSNPKIGVTYEPFDGLTFRGNMGTSFNAPSMADKQGATDTRLFESGTSTSRAPLNSAPGSATTPAQDAIDALRPSFLIAGGSRDLQSQTANTYSYGFDYWPKFAPGLELSLTRWHVSLYHLIAQAPYRDASQLYTIPAYSAYYILRPTQAQLEQATAGIVHAGFQESFAPYYQNGPNNTPYALVDARRHNIGNQFDEGLDFHVSYTVPASFGVVDFGLDGSDYTKSARQAYTGGPISDLLQYNLSPYALSTHISLTAGELTGRVTLNYSAGYDVHGVTNQTHVTAFEPINLYLNYNMSKLWDPLTDTSIGLTVNNLFDENPPFYNNGGGTANGSTLGRYFQINLQKKF